MARLCRAVGLSDPESGGGGAGTERIRTPVPGPRVRGGAALARGGPLSVAGSACASVGLRLRWVSARPRGLAASLLSLWRRGLPALAPTVRQRLRAVCAARPDGFSWIKKAASWSKEAASCLLEAI
jgi:hypothetical protein